MHSGTKGGAVASSAVPVKVVAFILVAEPSLLSAAVMWTSIVTSV